MNLLEQRMKNVIIAGKNIDSLVEYIAKVDFLKKMNIRIFHTNGNSLGDTLRDLDDLDYGFEDILVMYANHYSNIPFPKLMKMHRSQKKPYDDLCLPLRH